MASGDPLKSVIAISSVDDTSLALPSGSKHRSGQQRVLEQVQTIQRTKSRHSSSGRSGSASMSPTTLLSPVYDVFTDVSKSHTGAANGSVFFGNGFSKALTLDKNVNRPVVINTQGGSMKRIAAASNYYYERGSGGTMGVARNSSRSEPDLGWQQAMPKPSGSPQRLLSNMGSTSQSRSQFFHSTTSQPQLYHQIQTQIQSPVRKNLPSPIMSPTQIQPKVHPLIQTQIQSPVRYSFPNQIMNMAQIQTRVQPQFQNVTQIQQKPVPFAVNGTGATKSNSRMVSTQVETVKTFQTLPGSENAVKIKEDSGSNGNSGAADITLKEAVDYLRTSNESYQHCGASFIQHNTFIDDKAKEEVLKLGGIAPLVALLRSPSPQVNQTASAALRNLSFKNNQNKEEMHRCGTITEAVALLRETDSEDTEKQLTGLLWNLSSVDSLRPDLLKSALPAFMERVIVPHTTGQDSASSDPEIFFHATGCLRNISSSQQSNRQAMRKCRGLVDSLVTYVRDSVDAGKQDDKSVENCVCILHNLTFQLEKEVPALFSRITALAKNTTKIPTTSDTGPIGCFSPQSKSAETERHFDFPVVEEPQPSGLGWLIHSKTLQSYLSLLETSKREESQEACCGALLNLTTNEGIVSSVMSQIIVQKLNGLQVIVPLLKSNKVNLQRSAMALIGNLTKNPSLHNNLSRKALPELMSIISAGTKEGNESDDTLAMACHSANVLLMKDPEMGKSLLNSKLINSLNEISQNGYLPKSKKAAALLLYNMWSEKDLQSFLKKKGMTKASFVNDVTVTAHKSVQVVD